MKLKAKVTQKSKDRVYFMVNVLEDKSIEDIKAMLPQLQREAGYWPEGYGGPIEVSIRQDGLNGSIVEWGCYGSAD